MSHTVYLTSRTNNRFWSPDYESASVLQNQVCHLLGRNNFAMPTFETGRVSATVEAVIVTVEEPDAAVLLRLTFPTLSEKQKSDMIRRTELMNEMIKNGPITATIAIPFPDEDTP